MLQPQRTAYQQALDFLYGRIDYERAVAPRRELRLDRMHRLMAAVGEPHRHGPVVHVAGTKGKGSVSAMLAASLQAAGFRVGLYTSPHLQRLEERFTVDGRLCSEAELAALVERLRPVVEEFDQAGDPPTFFELTTAMAFLHFAQHDAQAAVVEVGMGGRLDSTNVCQPCLSVITSISFDHTRQLGGTLDEIAAEKAGIVKPGVPVVSGVITPGARQVIAAAAGRGGCRFVQQGVDFDHQYLPRAAEAPRTGPPTADDQPAGSRMTYTSSAGDPWGDLGELQLGMLGAHQAANASVALACLEELHRQGWPLGEAAVREGIATARCPARIEIVGRRPTIILDAAHNAASAAALAETVGEHFAGRRKRLLLAIARDKDLPAVLAPLAARFDELVVTRFLSNPRAADPQQVAAVARSLAADAGASGWSVRVVDDPHAALASLRQSSVPSDVICIAGSFFLAAELRGGLLADDLATRRGAAIMSGN